MSLMAVPHAGRLRNFVASFERSHPPVRSTGPGSRLTFILHMKIIWLLILRRPVRPGLILECRGGASPLLGAARQNKRDQSRAPRRAIEKADRGRGPRGTR